MKIKDINLKKIRTMISDRVYYYPRRIKRVLLSIVAFFIKEYGIIYKDTAVLVNISTKWDLDRARGGYEKFVVEQIYDALSRDNNKEVYYEIGACTGINSLIVSKLIKDKNGVCVAFEPMPVDIDTISKNILKNGIKNISIVPIAVSNRNGLGELYLCKPKVSSGQGGHSLKNAGFPAESHFIKIPCMRLEDAIKSFNLPLPTFISLDVEGHEKEVLEGMGEVLFRPGLRNIIIEVNLTADPYHSEVTDMLKKAGYFIKDYKSAGPRAKEHCMVNYEKARR